VSKNYYGILGVEKDATPEKIKKAYRALANKHHPDKNDGKESEVFNELVEAYECLGNEKNRSAYDNGTYTAKAESLEAKAERLVIEAFIKGLGHISEDEVKYKDLVEFMREQISGIIKTIKKEIKKLEGNKRKFTIARERITGKTGMLYDAATVNVNQLTLLIATGKDELEAFEAALLLVDDYEYETDPREHQPGVDLSGYGNLADIFRGAGFE